jgi:uncharacterized membrane protein YphA (DoxX/SURF4 family)
MKSEKRFAYLRIAFGFVWAIDAWFKWQPSFLNGLSDMLSSMAQGQPAWAKAWIELWIHIVNINPHLFAILVAIIETYIAISLIFGFFTRITLIGSIVFSLLLWSIGEGFGGPYTAGSTDIGCAIMYAFVAVALWIGMSWKTFSIDARFAKVNNPPAEVSDNSNSSVIKILILVIVILASIVFADHSPAPASTTMSMPSDQSAGTGPGAMAPMGMTLKTYPLQPTDPVPTVSFTITKDPAAMGGWDVHITTTNFTFTPQNVNKAPVADQGHAHLYVDNTMYVVYGDWYHLDDIPAGQHTITVSLMANDHSIFTDNGQYVEAKKVINE